MRKTALAVVVLFALLVAANLGYAGVTPDTNMTTVLVSYYTSLVEGQVFVETPGQNPEGGFYTDSLYYGRTALLSGTFALKNAMWNPIVYCDLGHKTFGIKVRTSPGGALMSLPGQKWFLIPGLVSQMVIVKPSGDTATATNYGVIGLANKPISYMRLR